LHAPVNMQGMTPSSNAPRPARPLRIALVTETFPPEVNGVALTIARVADGLRERGHLLQVLRPRQAADASAAAGTATRLFRGAPIPCYPHLRMGLPAPLALRRAWARERPDIVHIATEGPLGASALNAALAAGLPVTSDFRTNFQAYSGHYGLGWLRSGITAYLRRFHNRTGCTMVPTEALRTELQAQGFERLVVVGRGVDTVRFDPAWRSAALRRSWGAGPADRVLLYVGRLAAEKNLSLLLRAFAAMRQVDPGLRLVLVGDGPMRAALRAGCPEAVLAGPRSGADLAAHYASADLFVFPSLTETWGNVTPEALASGVPVLAFEHAAAAQLVRSGENGWLAPCGDADALVRLGLAWAARPGIERLHAEAARHSALDLGWGGVLRQIETVFYSTLIARHGTRPAAALAAEWGPT
jgi:glycosyltransferase involved in cell wall biosynthesis